MLILFSSKRLVLIMIVMIIIWVIIITLLSYFRISNSLHWKVMRPRIQVCFLWFILLNNYISWEIINIPYFGTVSWGLFLKSPGNFYVFRVCFKIKVYFENDKKKLSVNKAKLTSLGARKWTTIKQVLILKFVFLPKKLLGLSGNEALERTISQELAWKRSHT